MKNLTLSIAMLLASLCTSLNAQYVTIPDTAFVTFLQNNYPQCMQGNQMDTTCNAIVSSQQVICDNKNISNLYGIQYFDSLLVLFTQENRIDSILALPPMIQTLVASNNEISYISSFPDSLVTISLNGNRLSSLPDLPDVVRILQIKSNLFTELPVLKPSITELSFSKNQIDTIIYLPPNLITLNFDSNQITTIPVLPASLADLNCSDNPISSVPVLPNNLVSFYASSININTLPVLPNGLERLQFTNNNLDTVASFPNTLKLVFIQNNDLSSLPTLPDSLEWLLCMNNNLNSLPELPLKLNTLNVSSNPLYCLPNLANLNYLTFSFTNISCLPNYGQLIRSTPALSTVPLCDMYNPDGCDFYYNIAGRSYFDVNSNCVKDLQDTSVATVKVQLWENGQLIQQAFTGTEGFYSFDVQSMPGSYTTTIDTTSLPFQVACPPTGIYTSVINATDSMFHDRDFGLNCKSTSDLAVFDIYRSPGWFRPASKHQVNFTAGDLSQVYGVSCSSIGGQVKAVISGQASVGAFNGLLPTYINGDTVIWDVNDFSTVNIFNSFQFEIKIDSFALPQSHICVEVFVTPTTGDINPGNNYGSMCYEVVNSYDPNNKEVYPLSYIDTSQEWLYYTINFQNTGTAPALHVRIEDTLSSYLDLSSIQLLSYSHDNYTQISHDGVINFNFPNINLPDSTNDEPGSHGFIKYKVKLNDGLPVGTSIQNTAYIYFDFNAPIVTNTTVNTIIVPVAKPIVSANSFSGCEGDTIELETAYYPAYTYTWYKNDTAIINSNTNTLQATRSGTYKVSVTDGITDEVSDEQMVTLNPIPIATLTAASNAVCEDAPAVMLTPSPTGGSYTGATVTGNEFDPADNNIGLNTIEYYYTDVNGCSDSATLDIMVNEKPTVTFTLPTATYCEGGQAVDLTSYGDPAGGIYSGSSVSNDMLDVSAAGTLTVEYTYTDNNGCTNSKQANAIVEVCDGIEELEALGINIFPNPASNNIWIEFTDNTAIQQVKLIDLNGKVVATATTTYNGFNIDVSELPSQTYLLLMTNDEGKVVTSSSIQVTH